MATLVQNIATANIFNITQKGDRKILGAHQNAIILVGLTRVGKSTVYNWIQKKPMVGRGIANSQYVPVAENDPDTARVSASLASVTLAPNISREFQPNLSLIDMAGYQDTRNHVGVIGVSYFLQALFEKVRRVKFVIVFDELKFEQSTCQSLIKTFQGFINMFKFDLMTPQIKQRLKSSMSLVITKAKYTESHYDYITQILDKMKNVQFTFENKPLIMELLEYLRDSSRREGFQKARSNQQPTPCTFIERFNELKWKFFDFDLNQKQVGDSLISLPFTKDFLKLNEEQKYKFNQSLSTKVTNYLKYSEILRKLIENFVGNWEQCIYTWQRQKVFNFSSYKLNQFFEQVREFVTTNDVYDLNQTVSVEFRVNYQTPTLIQSINSILALQKIVQGIGSITDFETIKRKVVDSVTGEEIEEDVMVPLTNKDVMQRFKSSFAEIIKITKTFATSQDEQLLLQKSNFILQRGFREFQKFYQIDRSLISDIKIKLTGNCNSVFENTQTRIPWSVDFRERFVKNLDETLLTKIFPSFQSLNSYVVFFNKYAEERLESAMSYSSQEVDRCKIFFSEHKICIETAKADLLLAQLEKEKACLCYFDALKNINELYKCVSETQLYGQQTKSEEMDKISMRKLKLLKKIVNVLKVLESETNKFKKYSLQLAKHHNMVDDTCKLYQIVIESALGTDKSNFYQEYAEFCLEWAMTDKAKELLLSKLSLQEDSYKKYMEIVNQLKQIQNNKSTYEPKYTSNLSRFGRLNIYDASLDTLITKITEEVQVLIRALEMKKELPKE